MFKFADDIKMTELCDEAVTMWNGDKNPFSRLPHDYRTIVHAVHVTLRAKDARLRISIAKTLSSNLYELLRRGFPVFAMMSDIPELTSNTANALNTTFRRSGLYKCYKCDFDMDVSGTGKNMKLICPSCKKGDKGEMFKV